MNKPTYKSNMEQVLHYFERSHDTVPTAPVDSAADWRGPEMASQAERWIHTLPAPALEELSSVVDELMKSQVPMQVVTVERAPLPQLAPLISQWREEITNNTGFVLVRGLPVDQWSEEKSAYAYWILGHHLGMPGAQNPEGELLGHVINYEEAKEKPNVRSYRTSGHIDFHCDAADVVGLLCLQTAKSGGQSRIVSSVAIFNEIMRLEPQLVSRLFQPFEVDFRGDNPPGTPEHLPIQPCVYSVDGGLKTFYHSEYYRSAERFDDVVIDAEQRAVMDLYDALCMDDSFHLDMWLEPGDMQFISNHTVVHSRTEYEDWPEPERKRHLLRLWLSM